MDLKKTYCPGKLVQWPAFSSASTRVQQGFLGQDEGTLCVLHSRTACPIRDLSPYKAEEEVWCVGASPPFPSSASGPSSYTSPPPHHHPYPLLSSARLSFLPFSLSSSPPLFPSHRLPLPLASPSPFFPFSRLATPFSTLHSLLPFPPLVSSPLLSSFLPSSAPPSLLSTRSASPFLPAQVLFLPGTCFCVLSTGAETLRRHPSMQKSLGAIPSGVSVVELQELAQPRAPSSAGRLPDHPWAVVLECLQPKESLALALTGLRLSTVARADLRLKLKRRTHLLAKVPHPPDPTRPHHRPLRKPKVHPLVSFLW